METKEENETKEDCCRQSSKGMVNAKSYILVGVVALVLLISVVQAFQIKSLGNKFAAKAINSQGGLDMSGWTDDEKMNYEHHGVVPARLQQNTQQNMVGGC